MISGLVQRFVFAFRSRDPARKALSTAHVCDPPEAFILHREIVLTMKPNFTLRAYLMT